MATHNQKRTNNTNMINKGLKQLRIENINNIKGKRVSLFNKDVLLLRRKKQEMKTTFHSTQIFFKEVRKKLLKKLKKKKLEIKQKINKKKRIRIRVLMEKKRTRRRRYYFGGKRRKGPLKYMKRKHKRKLTKKRFKHIKFKNHYLTINIKRKNTFFSIYRQDFKITRKPYIIKRKKKKFHTYKVTIKQKNNLFITKSLGNLQYTGRNKTAPLAREVLGRTCGIAVANTMCTLIEVILKKKIGRIYKPFFKGLGTSKFGVRRLLIKIKHPHGFIRPRKKKRK